MCKYAVAAVVIAFSSGSCLNPLLSHYLQTCLLKVTGLVIRAFSSTADIGMQLTHTKPVGVNCSAVQCREADIIF